MVSAASRMLSAISFGVFCRRAPSTIAIMRSRKVSPGSAVMRTMIQSESTRVPPVTALRSPPLSRMTGALSPVMALSSTEAMPSIDLAVTGDEVAGLHEHEVAAPQVRRRHLFDRRVAPRFGKALGGHVLAGAPQGVGLGLAPSFGHGLGEVAEQHREPEPERDGQDEPAPTLRRRPVTSACRNSSVVKALPISTTNMTGFL